MNVKFIASGVGLVCLGATAAWAITADRADLKIKRLEAMVDDASSALKEKIKENIDLRYDLNDKVEELEAIHASIDLESGFTEEIFPGEELVEIDSGGEIDEVSEEEGPEPTDEEIEVSRSQLQALIDQYTPEKDTRDRLVDLSVSEVRQTRYTPPFVISQDEYSWSEEGDDYAKITLRYYPQHRVLLDEDEEPIDDVNTYVGWRALDRFGDQTDNADIVYVRNRRMETDFEVERVEDEDLPLHVKYAMPKMEFLSNKAAGKLRLSEEDM